MSTEASPQLRPNSVLIEQRKRRGWDSRRRAAREIYRLGMEHGLRDTPTAEALEKALYRHETGRTSVTDPIYRQLYCLAYAATPHELFGSVENASPGSAPSAGAVFTTRSHKFIPTFVGAEQAAKLIADLGLSAAEDQWLECFTGSVDHTEGRCQLYVWPFGVAMHHLVEEVAFPSLASLALWRDASYRANVAWVNEHLRTVLADASPSASYVFGAHWLVEAIWAGQSLDSALRLLCTPKVLLRRDLQDEASALAHAELVEKALLADGYESAEMVDYGIKGISMGHASWSGLVYYPTALQRCLLEEEFVACELAVQALWSYSEHINAQVELGLDPVVPAEYGWRFLRAMRSRVASPRPRENGQHRSMRNAVLQTSDVITHLAHAIDTLREVSEG